MGDSTPRGERRPAFLVAAVALPILVAAFFLIASLVPRWTVAPPAHDLVIRVPRDWNDRRHVAVDVAVRHDRVVATSRPAARNAYVPRWGLLLVDTRSQTAREIPLDIPDTMTEGDAPVEAPVAALAGVRVTSDGVAPDGYQLQPRSMGGRGIITGLFGMGRPRPRVVIVKQGRVVSIDLPDLDGNVYEPVHLVGWVVERESR